MGKTVALVCVIAFAVTCIAYGDSGNYVCSSPPDVDGAVTPQFTVSEHPIGTAVIYNCPPGYDSLNVSNHISFCKINTESGKAEWTLPNITCNRNSVCSSPPDVDGAVTPQLKASEHPVGTAVIYNCPPPRYASLRVTNQISFCRINTENGKAEWTSPNISCDRGCEIPKIPGGSFKEESLGDWVWAWERFQFERTINYVVIQSGSTVSSGTILWFYCDEQSYSVNGNGRKRVQIRCLRGRWSTELQCLRETDILCPPVETSGVFTLMYSNRRRINSTVTFFCKDNAKRIEGSRYLNCLPNGTWSGQIPKCVATDTLCPPIDRSRKFNLQYSNHRRVNSTVTFSCRDNSKRIEGSSILICLPNGTWSGQKPKCVDVTCEEPQPPKHGTVKLHGDIKVGSLATYSCYPGRKLNGDNTAVCLISGQWSFDAPECINVTCEEPQPPKHGTVKLYGDLKVGSLAIYSCDPGRKLNGYNTAVCLISGQWTFVAPECISAAECVLNLDPLSRLLVDPIKDVYRVEETISLSCPFGEEMTSQVYRIMCLPGGWTDSFPNCIKLNKEP